MVHSEKMAALNQMIAGGATKPIDRGTGLGLAISYQIVTETHKGKIRCDSTLGEGTKFGIEIPIH
jgi:signal transduction histidine kinase